MSTFIVNAIIWTLAIYGLLEIIKNIIFTYTYTNLKADGIYMIIAVKNQENKIEVFLRSILFRILYGKDEYIRNVIVTDLNSKDNTKEILDKLSKDYKYIEVVEWKEFKEIMENINNV